ncbi:MAG: hypothetical protein U0361_21720 [Nitrospiraceae bacterium]
MSREDTGGTKRTKKKAIDPYHAEQLRQREELVIELEGSSDISLRSWLNVRSTSEGRAYTEREQRLKTLERDYETLQKNYQSLLDKKLSAALAKNMARGRKGAEARVVDPAYTPIVPVVPNIPSLCLLASSLDVRLVLAER